MHPLDLAMIAGGIAALVARHLANRRADRESVKRVWERVKARLDAEG